MELGSVRQGGKLGFHELWVRPIPDGANDIQRDWSRAISHGRPDSTAHATAHDTADPEADLDPVASAAAGSASLAAWSTAVRGPATCSRAGADEAALLAGSEPNSRTDLE